MPVLLGFLLALLFENLVSLVIPLPREWTGIQLLAQVVLVGLFFVGVGLDRRAKQKSDVPPDSDAEVMIIDSPGSQVGGQYLDGATSGLEATPSSKAQVVDNEVESN